MQLRQRSQLEMNRRIKWTQEPPNFDDYAPECLDSGNLALQLQAMPGDAKGKVKCDPSPGGAVKVAPKKVSQPAQPPIPGQFSVLNG